MGSSEEIYEEENPRWKIPLRDRQLLALLKISETIRHLQILGKDFLLINCKEQTLKGVWLVSIEGLKIIGRVNFGEKNDDIAVLQNHQGKPDSKNTYRIMRHSKHGLTTYSSLNLFTDNPILSIPQHLLLNENHF
jgi:hypothetical protein